MFDFFDEDFPLSKKQEEAERKRLRELEKSAEDDIVIEQPATATAIEAVTAAAAAVIKLRLSAFLRLLLTGTGSILVSGFFPGVMVILEALSSFSFDEPYSSGCL